MSSPNYCPKCGRSIGPDDIYCPYCGYRISASQTTPERSKHIYRENASREIPRDIVERFLRGVSFDRYSIDWLLIKLWEAIDELERLSNRTGVPVLEYLIALLSDIEVRELLKPFAYYVKDISDAVLKDPRHRQLRQYLHVIVAVLENLSSDVSEKIPVRVTQRGAPLIHRVAVEVVAEKFLKDVYPDSTIYWFLVKLTTAVISFEEIAEYTGASPQDYVRMFLQNEGVREKLLRLACEADYASYLITSDPRFKPLARYIDDITEVLSTIKCRWNIRERHYPILDTKSEKIDVQRDSEVVNRIGVGKPLLRASKEQEDLEERISAREPPLMSRLKDLMGFIARLRPNVPRLWLSRKAKGTLMFIIGVSLLVLLLPGSWFISFTLSYAIIAVCFVLSLVTILRISDSLGKVLGVLSLFFLALTVAAHSAMISFLEKRSSIPDTDKDMVNIGSSFRLDGWWISVLSYSLSDYVRNGDKYYQVSEGMKYALIRIRITNIDWRIGGLSELNITLITDRGNGYRMLPALSRPVDNVTAEIGIKAIPITMLDMKSFLLPAWSVEGHILYEIPANETPLELYIGVCRDNCSTMIVNLSTKTTIPQTPARDQTVSKSVTETLPL